MKYTIEQNGERWVASDGTHHVEGEDAESAFFDLMSGRVMSEVSGRPVEEEARAATADDAESSVGRMVLQLVRLLALKAPGTIIRHAVEVLGNNVERFIALAELD